MVDADTQMLECEKGVESKNERVLTMTRARSVDRDSTGTGGFTQRLRNLDLRTDYTSLVPKLLFKDLSKDQKLASASIS